MYNEDGKGDFTVNTIEQSFGNRQLLVVRRGNTYE